MTATDEDLSQRLARLEESAPPRHGEYRESDWPTSPVIDPTSVAGQIAAAQDRKHQERLAAARAGEDRLRRAAEAAELERQRQWEKHRPKRERALTDLAQLKPEIDKLESEIDKLESRASELRRRRSDLRDVAQQFGKPIEN